MIRICLLCSLFVTVIAAGYAQGTPKDTLSLEDGFWGKTYKQGSREITSKEFKNLLRSSRDSTVYQLYSSGSTLSSLADVVGFVGGFGVGYGVATKPSNTTAIVVGAVAIVGAIVLETSGQRKMQEALTRFNDQIRGSIAEPYLIRTQGGTRLVSFSIRF